VPDKYVYGIVEDALNKADKGFLLDGFPRNMEQAEFLDSKFEIDNIVIYDLSDEKAIERIMARRNCKECKTDFNILFKKPKEEGVCDLCGGELVQRADDNEAAVSKRIEKFHAETKPVIDFFKDKKTIVYINADQTPDEIMAELESKIL